MMVTILEQASTRFIHRAQRDGYQVNTLVPTADMMFDRTPPMFQTWKSGATTLSRLWAVTKPSIRPGTEIREFGIQRRHFVELIEVSNRFFEMYCTQFSVHDTKLIFYIISIDEFMKISLKKAEEVGRTFAKETIHVGGTVFIQVGDCVELGMTEHGTVQKRLDGTG